jgi:hypothetical protein
MTRPAQGTASAAASSVTPAGGNNSAQARRAALGLGLGEGGAGLGLGQKSPVAHEQQVGLGVARIVQGGDGAAQGRPGVGAAGEAAGEQANERGQRGGQRAEIHPLRRLPGGELGHPQRAPALSAARARHKVKARAAWAGAPSIDPELSRHKRIGPLRSPAFGPSAKRVRGGFGGGL